MKDNRTTTRRGRLLIIVVLHIISFYYIIHASINDGITGILLGIPFVVYLVIQIFRRKHFCKYINVVVLVCCCIIYFSDRSTSTLVYPMVGEKLEITKEAYFTQQNRWIEYVYFENDEKYPRSIFEVGTKIHVVNQIFTGHPDFSVAYRHKIDIELDGVTEKYGISGSMLGQLFKSQQVEFKENRAARNTLAFQTHNFISYSIVLVIFVGLSLFVGRMGNRDSKIQQGDSFIDGQDE